MRKRFLANWPIARKTGLISALSFVGLLLVASGYFAVRWYEAGIQQVRDRSDEAALVTRTLSENFLLARRAEKDFLLRLDEKYSESHRQISADVGELLKQLEALSPDQSSDIRLFLSGYAAYDQQFEKVVGAWRQVGYSEEEGLRGTLRNSVHKAETRLNSLNEYRPKVTLLMMRRHEKDFLLRLNPKYIPELEKRRAELAEDLEAVGIAPAERQEIMALVNAYQTDFNRLAGLRLELIEDTAALSRLFSETSPVADRIIESVLKKAEAARADLENTHEVVQFGLIAFILLVGTVVVLVSQLVGRSISRPLSALSSEMEQLSAGNKDIQPETAGKDEIAAMGKTLLLFRERLEEGDQLRAKEQQEIEERLKRAEHRRKLTEEFRTIVVGILSTVSSASEEMRTTSENMTRLSDISKDRVGSVAQATDETSANIQTVAAASEELTASIREISAQTMNATTLAVDAVGEAENGKEVISALSESAKRISDVVTLIQDIAEQTNLLALNATIEAARAGDAGKGFAVVASEVKTLANQTAKATDEISAQIGEVLSRVGQAVTSISAVSSRIGEVSNVSTSISAAVEEQSSATEEISRNVDHAASATAE
ncbi:MAG: methyl-accepting chemotaxis protein, partial [Rhodospirillales bacterium]